MNNPDAAAARLIKAGVPLFMTRTELAEILGIPPKRLSAWVKRGKLPGPREGTRCYSVPLVAVYLSHWGKPPLHVPTDAAMVVEPEIELA